MHLGSRARCPVWRRGPTRGSRTVASSTRARIRFLTEAPGHPADRPKEEVAKLTHEPDEIDDEEHEEVAERVAAIDVAKASGMVCIRLPHEKVPGRRVTKVWQVSPTTNPIMTPADELAGLGLQPVVVES